MHRRCTINGFLEDWKIYKTVKKIKKKTIKREETLFYRQQLTEVTLIKTGL